MFYHDQIPSFFHDQAKDSVESKPMEKRQEVPIFYNKDMVPNFGIWKKEILREIAKELKSKKSVTAKDEVKKSAAEETEKKNIK